MQKAMSPKFNPYYRVNHLLVQFMLFELITLASLTKAHKGSSLFSVLSEKATPLNKLKTYTEAYLKNLNKHRETDKLFYALIQETLILVQQATQLFPPHSIKQLLLQLRQQLKKIHALFPVLLYPFRKNEFVILFIMKNSAAIQQIYGLSFADILLTASSTNTDLLIKLLNGQFFKNNLSQSPIANDIKVFSDHVLE